MTFYLYKTYEYHDKDFNDCVFWCGSKIGGRGWVGGRRFLKCVSVNVLGS